MKIRTLLLSAVLTLSAAAFAQDAAKVSYAPKAGDARKFKVLMTLSVAGAEAKVQSGLTQTVKSVDGDKFKEEITWEGFSVELNGAVMDGLEASPSITTTKADGQLLEFTGGIPGTDAPRIHLMGLFVPPTKALAKDEKAETAFDANADKTIPARKYETTYLGKEQVGGKDVLKFKVKYSEKEPGGMTFDITYWISEAGMLAKAEGTFSELFVPQAGATSSGTFKLESVG